MYLFLAKLSKKTLFNQIELFYKWKAARYPTKAYGDRDTLMRFAFHCNKKDACHVTNEDVENFNAIQSSYYMRTEAERAVRQLVEFSFSKNVDKSCKCANIKCVCGKKLMRKTNSGRKAESIDEILLVKKLKDEGINGRGLSFRDIARIMNRNISLCHRWYHYPMERLPAFPSQKLST